MSDDHDFEPVPGLPAALPPDERLLWQGAPDWRALAVHAFHIRKVAVYFAILIAAETAQATFEGLGAAALPRLAGGVALALAALGILALLAWLSARSCIYSVTTRRVVMRYGVALPMVINIPFRSLAAADMAARTDGSGDIVLRPRPPERIAYFALWPHARPWRFARPEPMLRSLPDAVGAARILAGAMAAAEGSPAPVMPTAPSTGGERLPQPLAA